MNRFHMTLSLEGRAKPMSEQSLQLCLEDASQLTKVFTHLLALPLGHADSLVGALYAGGVGHPPQHGGRLCTSSQEHLTWDCQSGSCIQQDGTHQASEPRQGTGVTPVLASISKSELWTFPHLLEHLSPANSFLRRKLSFLI